MAQSRRHGALLLPLVLAISGFSATGVGNTLETQAMDKLSGHVNDYPMIMDQEYQNLTDQSLRLKSRANFKIENAEAVQSFGGAYSWDAGVLDLDDEQKTAAEKDTADMLPFIPKDLENPEDWKRKYFDVVVWINKSSTGTRKQALEIYQEGKLVYRTRISSGREKFETGSDDPTQKSAPTKSYFTSTPTGYFTPYYLNIDHTSKQWKDAFMPYAVFFNGGIAFHQAPGGTEGRLGSRASGGCVRSHPLVAPDLFWRVRMSGGPFTSAENSKETFRQQAAYYAPHYGTPHSSTPMIPKFTKRGTLVLNKNQEIVMQKGFRTLVIVEDREINIQPRMPKPNPFRLKAILDAKTAKGETVTAEQLAQLETENAEFDPLTPIAPPKEMQPVFVPKVQPELAPMVLAPGNYYDPRTHQAPMAQPKNLLQMLFGL